MKMLNRKEAAAALGISVRTLDQLRKDRRIGFYQAREGCKVQFTQAHIDKYLNKLEQSPKEKPRKTKVFRGISNFLTLGELGGAAGCLETVLLELVREISFVFKRFVRLF